MISSMKASPTATACLATIGSALRELVKSSTDSTPASATPTMTMNTMSSISENPAAPRAGVRSAHIAGEFLHGDARGKIPRDRKDDVARAGGAQRVESHVRGTGTDRDAARRGERERPAGRGVGNRVGARLRAAGSGGLLHRNQAARVEADADVAALRDGHRLGVLEGRAYLVGEA